MFNPSHYDPIDLSIGLEPDVESEPWPPEMEYFDHEAGASLLAENLRDSGFDVHAEDFPEGIGLGWEEITAITHTATHMDAPSHYGPRVDGEPAATIDEVPVEWAVGLAVVLDFTWKEAGTEITSEEIDSQLGELDHELSAGEILLIETGADDNWGSVEYLTDFPGMSRAATKHVVEQGVHVIGTDAYGFDKPFPAMGARYAETGDDSELWPAHFAGRDVEYCQIEKMSSLDSLPRRTDIPLVTAPVKVQNGSAGWVRPLAFIEK